jgi:hypothetical protein
MRPAKPVDTVSRALPLALVLVTSAGAVTGLPLRAVMGCAPCWLLSVQVTSPYCHTLSAALVRVRLTV